MNLKEELYNNNSNNHNDWNSRLSKAVFYGSLTVVRQIFFDISNKRPDLIDAKWINGRYTVPWNPNSKETRFEDQDIRFSNYTIDDKPAEIGTLKNLLKNRLSEREEYDFTKYKFVVVLTGLDGRATADRLPTLLAHSGSVVLIQEHEFAYTFSSFLKPWVHYVPLTYTTADIINKIEFLIAHDHIAKRLAVNARNFGVSHLRFEDYMCYVASALHAISNITSTFDANIPFNQTEIEFPVSFYY